MRAAVSKAREETIARADAKANQKVATQLRMQSRTVAANRSQVLDDVYEYVCGQEFQHHITNTVVAALTMKAELDAERTAAERLFKKREKQIEAQLRNIAGMYGGLQGIAGGALQPVAALELPPGIDDETGPLALAS